MELNLGLWHGFWNKSTDWWLRWYDRLGQLIPTPEEVQTQAKELERRRAVQAEQGQLLAQQQATGEHQRALQAARDNEQA